MEYYDLRAKGRGHKDAFDIVQEARTDDPIFTHAKRPPRKDASFSREMRYRRNEALAVLDLLTLTPEQIATLQKYLANPKRRRGAKTRK